MHTEQNEFELELFRHGRMKWAQFSSAFQITRDTVAAPCLVGIYFFTRTYQLFLLYFALFWLCHVKCQVTLFPPPPSRRRRRRRRRHHRCTFPVAKYNLCLISPSLALRSKPSLSKPHLTPIVLQFR